MQKSDPDLEFKRARQREYSRRWRSKPGNRELQRQRQRRSWELKPEVRAASTKRYRDSVRAILEAAKDVPCAVCGLAFPAVCMDFHHRDPGSKQFDLGDTRRRRGKAAILAEIVKCDVVCACCHRLIEHGANKIAKI